MTRLIVLLRGRALFMGALTLALLFTVLTALVLREDLQPTGWDIGITHEIQEFPQVPVGEVLVWVSGPGFFPWNYIMPGMVVLFMLAMRWFVQGVFTTLASAGGLLAELVKHLVDRPRPTPEFATIYRELYTASFPSGHVTGYTVLYGFVFYLAYTHLPRKSPVRWVVMGICALLVLLVGLSRVYMGQHWASDVLAGYALGFSYLLLVIAAHQAYLARGKSVDGGAETVDGGQ
ncbi:MAG: phosphatase PAP2 family protein [Chloroflexia bacterium]